MRSLSPLQFMKKTRQTGELSPRASSSSSHSNAFFFHIDLDS
ncbi:hypothetical protein CSUI_010343 [Cystoisospora suis]|uniref:Uncharacterized protein n=1 Tax=Cystoisospora suis TaxID=483139 RepID=A0A2C6KHP4_9APIC|nr:hypothetical protein CSUI_010343 [Cystoisospora suis]